MNVTPLRTKIILNYLEAKQAFEDGAIQVVFRIEENSQFYTVWQAYVLFDE